MRRLCAAALLATLLFSSCKEKNGVSSGILTPEKMKLVLWDIIRADVYTENFISRDSSKDKIAENIKLQQQIFQLHHISKEEYYNSWEYYKKKPAIFNTIIDSLQAYAGRDRQKAVKIAPVKGN